MKTHAGGREEMTGQVVVYVDDIMVAALLQIAEALSFGRRRSGSAALRNGHRRAIGLNSAASSSSERREIGALAGTAILCQGVGLAARD